MLIPSLCGDSPSERHVVSFARVCARLAAACLRMHEAAGYRIRETRNDNGAELASLATDCIANLFERDPDGRFVRLRRYFSEHLASGLREEEWLILVRRLVANSTRQGLFRVFRERDPEGARLWRSIRRFSAAHPRFRLLETAGRDWICERRRRDGAGPRFVRALFENPEVRADCFASFRPGDAVPVLIAKTFDAAQRIHGPQLAIEASDLVRLFRSYRSRFHRPSAEPTVAGGDPEQCLAGTELQAQIDKARERLFRKIDRDYAGRGKLDAASSEGIKGAIERMFEDMMNGGLSGSNLDYLRESLDGLDAEAYRTRLRIPFEYLIRLMKKEVLKIIF
jgi:hypothetical protein